MKILFLNERGRLRMGIVLMLMWVAAAGYLSYNYSCENFTNNHSGTCQ